MSTLPNPTTLPTPAARAISDLQLRDAERSTSGGGLRLGRFVFLLLLGLLAFGGYTAYQRNPQLLNSLNRNQVDTATVLVKGHEAIALELSGFVVPYRKVNVSPRIPGTITEITFDVSQLVKKGDLLAQLDDASYQADLQQAQASLQAAKSRVDEMRNGALPEELSQARTALAAAVAKVELLTNEVARAEKLGDNVTPQELDQLKSSLSDADANAKSLDQKLKLLEKGPRAERIKGAEAEVLQAQALVTKAQYYLDNAKILAPLDGTVLEKKAEVGEILRPEVLSTSLCVLADLTTMEVEIDVQERDLQKIEIGRLCTIIPDAYPDRKYAGKIDRIQPQVNRQRGVVRVTIRIDAPDRYLLPDMNVRALIDNVPAEGNPETLWIPEAAVRRTDDVATVFVIAGDKAVQKTVTLGPTEGKKVQVLDGLSAGDVVALPGSQTLTDGQAVTPKAKK